MALNSTLKVSATPGTLEHLQETLSEGIRVLNEVRSDYAAPDSHAALAELTEKDDELCESEECIRPREASYLRHCWKCGESFAEVSYEPTERD